jgi:hypothetical protein
MSAYNPDKNDHLVQKKKNKKIKQKNKTAKSMADLT